MGKHQLQKQASLVGILVICQADVDMAICHDSVEDKIEFLENLYFLFVVSKSLEHLRPEGKVGTQKIKNNSCYFVFFIFLFVLYQKIGQVQDVFKVDLIGTEFVIQCLQQSRIVYGRIELHQEVVVDGFGLDAIANPCQIVKNPVHFVLTASLYDFKDISEVFSEIIECFIVAEK